MIVSSRSNASTLCVSSGTSAIWWRARFNACGNDKSVRLSHSHADSLDGRPVFVLDDALRGPSGPNRLAFLYRALRDLSDRTDGADSLRAFASLF